MRNKFIFSAFIFMCFCTQAFSQVHSIDKEIMDSFINDSYWFHKYLPLEYIPDYDVLREMLNAENSAYETDADIYEYIPIFYTMLFERLHNEIIPRNEKMNVLLTYYPGMEELRDLNNQHLNFNTDIEKQNFPQDDNCLEIIDEYYSRLIIRLGFTGMTGGKDYLVKEGDYFRKIAKTFYGIKREGEWKRIFEANKNNEELLPYPSNPDLIRPHVKITVPYP